MWLLDVDVDTSLEYAALKFDDSWLPRALRDDSRRMTATLHDCRSVHALRPRPDEKNVTRGANQYHCIDFLNVA